MRLCRSFDLASSQPSEAARARLLTPAVKYWICKTAPALIYEAMECLGGNGYVEEGALARLYREAPVNAIWEGSGNVMALDVLRAFARDGGAAQTTVTELAGEAQGLRGVEEAVEMIARTLSDRNSETNARAAVERLALLAATAALQTSVAPEIAAAFARARLSGARAATFGAAALDPGDIAVLLRRALPES
jgi:putative acyl-CoA dehydrogenase